MPASSRWLADLHRLCPIAKSVRRNWKPSAVVKCTKPVKKSLGLGGHSQQCQAAKNAGDAEPVMIRKGPNVGDAGGEVGTLNDLPACRQSKAKETKDALVGLHQIGLQDRIALEGGDVLFGEKRGVGIELAWLWERE